MLNLHQTEYKYLAAYQDLISPIIEKGWNYMPDFVNRYSQYTCNPGVYGQPSNLIYSERPKEENGWSNVPEKAIYAFSNGITGMAFITDGELKNRWYIKNEFNNDLGVSGQETMFRNQNEGVTCRAYIHQHELPLYAKTVISECPVRQSPMIIQLYHTPLTSPYGQNYIMMDRPNYIGCFKREFLFTDYKQYTFYLNTPQKTILYSFMKHADQIYHANASDSRWFRIESAQSYNKQQKVDDSYCKNDGESNYLNLYSYLDDGSDLNRDFFQQIKSANDNLKTNFLTFTPGNGSIHFKNQDEGNPTINYSQNTYLTYEDGTLIKEILQIQNTNFNQEKKTFQGSIMFSKPVGYLLKNSEQYSFGRNFNIHLEFEDDYSKIIKQSIIVDGGQTIPYIGAQESQWSSFFRQEFHRQTENIGQDIIKAEGFYMYYSTYDYKHPFDRGNEDLDKQSPEYLKGQGSMLPSCIWRFQNPNNQDLYQQGIINGWKEDIDPILCTTYDKRMQKQQPLAVDPSVFIDRIGKFWMVLGNYWNGIHIVELDHSGKVKNQEIDNVKYNFVAKGPPTFDTIDDRHSKGGAIGSPSVYYNQDLLHYFLFVTWKQVIDGKQRTQIRVGKSISPEGPYVDKNGCEMTQECGELLIDSETFVLENEFKLSNPKRAHHFQFKDKEYLSFQITVTKVKGVDENIDSIYRIDPDPYSRSEDEYQNWSKQQLGVYKLSWNSNGWPQVDLEDQLEKDCAQEALKKAQSEFSYFPIY